MGHLRKACISGLIALICITYKSNICSSYIRKLPPGGVLRKDLFSVVECDVRNPKLLKTMVKKV